MVTPPIVRKHWKIYSTPIPAASSLLNISLHNVAFFIISRKILTHTSATHIANIRPNSSAIAENTKSLLTTGIDVGSPP